MSLESAYVFGGVSESTRAAIAAIAVEETHAAGDRLFAAGDAAQNLYILLEGRLRLSTLRGGGLLSHIVSDPGAAVGWSSMAGSGTYTGSVTCTAAARLLRIDRDELNRILEADPTSGLAFYRHLAQIIGRRLVDSYGATLSLHAQGDLTSYG